MELWLTIIHWIRLETRCPDIHLLMTLVVSRVHFVDLFIMRYFSQELVAALNSTDPNVVNKADQEWEYNVSRYKKQLSKLQHVLPVTLAKLELHDAAVREISVKDGVRKTSGICVEVALQQGTQKTTLRYFGVQKIALQYACRDKGVCGFSFSGLGDWLVDEISWVRNKFIRQEILFESGAVLLLEFTVFEIA
jgi:hypothetical protein